MRVRHLLKRGVWVVAASLAVLLSSSTAALSQQGPEITPKTSITPSSHVTSWIFQIAVASAVLAVLVLIGFLLSYLRFAPKFFGREDKPRLAPPGTRPVTLTRQAAAMRWTPQAVPAGAHAAPAPASGGRAAATAVAERPAPPTRPAPAEAPSQGAAAAAEATTKPTAGPSGEPAVQADAVGSAAEPSGQPAAPALAPAAPAPAAASHGATLDQETFDRVLEEQLGKGVDRRVAEGRARAAAVVAARKKAQG